MDVVINSDCNSIPKDSNPLVSQGNLHLNFLSVLNYDSNNVPYGNLLRQLHNLEGNWLILSPVHWQASHNDAMIAAYGKELQLSESDSRYWFQLYAEYLAGEGIRLFYHDVETWLLDANNLPAIKAKPVNQIVNNSLMPELAQLDPTMFWQKFFTEAQMFFASHLNQSALNGVWIWGEGPLTVKNMAICADESFMPIAQICSTNVTLYNPNLNLKSFQIILLNNTDNLSQSHQAELNRIPARWYWNNVAYTRCDRNWFARLWRMLTHAD